MRIHPNSTTTPGNSLKVGYGVLSALIIALLKSVLNSVVRFWSYFQKAFLSLSLSVMGLDVRYYSFSRNGGEHGSDHIEGVSLGEDSFEGSVEGDSLGGGDVLVNLQLRELPEEFEGRDCFGQLLPCD